MCAWASETYCESRQNSHFIRSSNCFVCARFIFYILHFIPESYLQHDFTAADALLLVLLALFLRWLKDFVHNLYIANRFFVGDFDNLALSFGLICFRMLASVALCHTTRTMSIITYKMSWSQPDRFILNQRSAFMSCYYFYDFLASSSIQSIQLMAHDS